jgi:hypothetical protein
MVSSGSLAPTPSFCDSPTHPLTRGRATIHRPSATLSVVEWADPASGILLCTWVSLGAPQTLHYTTPVPAQVQVQVQVLGARSRANHFFPLSPVLPACCMPFKKKLREANSPGKTLPLTRAETRDSTRGKICVPCPLSIYYLPTVAQPGTLTKSPRLLFISLSLHVLTVSHLRFLLLRPPLTCAHL